MPKFTLDNSFRFYSQKETTLNFHSESIDRLLQKLTSADWLRLFARQEQIQAYLFGWKNMLLKINDVLADAMKKQATNQSVNMWLAKLQNLAYDAEDLLDEFPTEAFQRLGEATSQASTSHQPDSMAMAKVKDVNVRFQEIASQIDILGLKSRYVRRRLTPTSLIVLLGLKSRKVPIEIGPAQNAGNSRLVFFEGCNLVFELEDLLRASAELLGKGTFGTAYKVTLEDAKTVVVKRMKGVNVGKREFEQQMEVVGSIRHENVAALRGYYYSKDEKFPVYDYFEQGCVSDMIHGKRDEGQSSLDWETRVRIAVGAARGIAHIHTKKAGKFVHGGIKATNIFLNSQGHVCVSDIGLAALTSPMPQPAKGTAGYRAPEVTDTRKATQASDVYSFGVLLLELLTGKSPMHATGDKVVHLVSWVTSVAREEWTEEVFDVGLLRYPNIKEEMVAMLHIGMACVVRVPEQRPKMVDVVKMVEEIRQGSTKNVLSVQKSRRETTPDFHSESIERLLQKLASDWLPVFARENLIQADLRGWKKILGDIKDVLDDAMKKQVRNQSVKTWLAQLQNLAYDVEDLLDKFQTESFKRPGEATSQLSTSYQFDSMAMSEVKEVNSRLQDIASQIVLLGLKSGNVGNSRLVLFEGHNFVFDLEDLFRASAELLGKGTFGTAYKATLEDGSIVVVKRLKGVNVVKREFEQQMEVVGRTRHENVAALKAFYYSKDEKLLVYDYFEQGSVSAMFHGRRDEGQSSLDWETRVRIAVGVARGIAHIHTKNDGKLVHGGIKASNIFLNSEGHVCVSDVGLEAMMSSMKPPPMGAAGYRAPEVTETRKATQASDVYGFGVLLLELLTGKSPVHATGGDKTVHLVSWIISIAREEWTAEVFDVDLLWYPNIEEEMVQMLQIGMDCVRRVPEQRPKMVDVVKMIEDIRRVKNDVSILKSSEISSLAPTPKATEIASSSNPR